MNAYAKLKARQQQEFNALPLGFAFSNQQFKEMMQTWGLEIGRASCRERVSTTV